MVVTVATAGSSLRSTAAAASLLDWAETAELDESMISVVGEFMASKDIDGQAQFDEQLDAVDAMVATLTGEDAVLFFSYSGATKDMMETLSVVRQQGAKVVLVTRFPLSPGAALADAVLQCGSNESPLQLGSVPARMAQLFLLDILFNRLCQRDMDASQRATQRIAEALAEKHL